MAACFPPLPPDAEVLDIGGGDGELLGRILALNPGTRAMMIDLAPRIGGALRPEIRERVTLLPGTSLADYRVLGRPAPVAIFLSDVLHHVPELGRPRVLEEVRALVGERTVRLVVKEFAPGGLRSRLGWLADRYVSGDRDVRFLAPEELRALVAEAFPGWEIEETPLRSLDPPNYCLVCTRVVPPAA